MQWLLRLEAVKSSALSWRLIDRQWLVGRPYGSGLYRFLFCAVLEYRHTPWNVSLVNIFPVYASWFLISKLHRTYVSFNTTLSVHICRNNVY